MTDETRNEITVKIKEAGTQLVREMEISIRSKDDTVDQLIEKIKTHFPEIENKKK